MWLIVLVRSMIKMRQDNDMTRSYRSTLRGNKIELLWSIWYGTVYDKDQIG